LLTRNGGSVNQCLLVKQLNIILERGQSLPSSITTAGQSQSTAAIEFRSPAEMVGMVIAPAAVPVLCQDGAKLSWEGV
jgi:hypothetical protein